mgnify:CR=1 FL=1
MNLTQIVSYGGCYREVWDDSYNLKIIYKGQKDLRLTFREGRWCWDEGTLPDLPLAESFFPQAADAAVAVKRFLASGQTVRNLAELAPGQETGPVFAAEFLRSLLDDYGMNIETVYPYVVPFAGERLNAEEMDALNRLQARSFHLLQVLYGHEEVVPPMLHDIRLPEFRSPVGAAVSGETVRLAFAAPQGNVTDAVLELWGDSLNQEFSMEAGTDGWAVSFQAPDTPAPLWYRFRVRIAGESDPVWLCAAPDGIHSWPTAEAKDGFRFTVAAESFETPAWFQGSVMYQIFPDRFAFSDDGTAEKGIEYHRTLGQTPELHHSRREEVRWQPRAFEKTYMPDDFYGGTLKGIRSRLPYLRDLGINCLYLNPIMESRSNHRYDTSDYLRVDPILGTNEDFTALCRAARELGIRILCDGVFSHTGADSVYFNRDGHYPNSGACQNAPSPYDSWYDFRHFPDDYRSWWGFRELPEVNELDPSWQDFVVSGENSVVRQWLRRGASGWRLDVADELPDEVLELIRDAAKQEDPDSVILGEVWEDAVLKESYGSRRRYALGTALDSVMNYPFRTAVLDFLHGRIDAFALAAFLTGQMMHYPKPLYRSLMNLLGTHDIERLQNALASPVTWKDLSREDQLALEAGLKEEDWQRAERLERLAIQIQFSVPGVPSIYYGDEIGMRGTNDPFNRRPMREGERSEEAVSLLCEFRNLAQLRRNHPALRGGDAFFLACDGDVLLIYRFCAEEKILTVVNRADEEREYSIWLPDCRAEGTVAPCSAQMRIL